MRKLLIVLFASLSLTLGVAGSASAAPTNFPDNPNACVGFSSTTANARFQDEDPDKYRSDQAHGAYVNDNERGRRDNIIDIFNESRCTAH